MAEIESISDVQGSNQEDAMKMKSFTLKMKEEDSVMSHIAEFKKIVADLVSMEVKYDDEDLGLLLLCSLLNSYANFRDTILLSRDELTLKEVYEALQSREKMRGMVQNDGTSSSKDDALHVRGRTENRSSNDGNDGRKNYERRGRSKSKPHGNKKFCVYCKLTNHNVEDCRKVQNKEKRKNKSAGRLFMSVSVVFNESVMFIDGCPRIMFRKKSYNRHAHAVWSMLMMIQKACGAVDEHGDHDNDVAEDDAHDDVQRNSSYFALRGGFTYCSTQKSKKTIAPPKRLIEECNLSYYAFELCQQWRMFMSQRTYKEAICCGDT
ncbi:unnamed protein product [Miscanthus lutarioriparius]|uniref:Uncharacterized protein n=1 Tax=Miscanthus lutarioriparius TaxID=422564 RepID=A0A811QPN7_9POAL|nr:unnamed protein product [Miscanthus lutarioriparius]